MPQFYENANAPGEFTYKELEHVSYNESLADLQVQFYNMMYFIYSDMH
jgi:hypothetical protein